MTKVLNPKKISSKLTMTPHEQRASHEGMAHFAGTGPRGRTCRECIFWDYFKGDYRKSDGRIKDARCKKFTSLSRGQKGRVVPNEALACKYFDLNNDAPKEYQR